MKNYYTFLLFFCLFVMLGFSCKKEGTSDLKDAALTKTATTTETDSLSGFYLSVNGSSVAVSDTVIRVIDSTSAHYVWWGRNINSGYSLFIVFSGSAVVFNSYAITPGNLFSSSAQCYFTLSGDHGGGSASSGVVTVSQGNSKIASFTNILCAGTLSNVPTTFTISGVLPLH